MNVAVCAAAVCVAALLAPPSSGVGVTVPSTAGVIEDVGVNVNNGVSVIVGDAVVVAVKMIVFVGVLVTKPVGVKVAVALVGV